MRYRHLVSLLIATALLALLGPSWAGAQTSTTGTVSGIVTDASGAVLAGAEVELVSVATGQSVKQMTNESGQYVFASVLPGDYNLTMTAKGFRKTSIPGVKVEVAKSYTFNAAMEVGEVEQTVVVTDAAGAELQTTDSTIGNVIPGKVMPLFPALTRQANELVRVQPLTTPNGEVAGSRADQSTFMLDGIDVTNNSVGGLTTYMVLPIDGIEEFRVGVANPNAAFGRGAGGQVSVISKRGGNQFHGTTYWYHQNDNLNAATWTNKRTLGQTETDPVKRAKLQKPELKDNRFGFNFGGPVLPWKDKAFFFVNYEGRRFPRTTSILRIVPTDTLRQGILRFRDGAGNIVSYNLASSALCGTGTDASPATGVCDPRGLGLSPSISALWQKLPAGNDPSAGDGLNTIGFRGNVGNPLKNNYYNARFDYNITDRWRADASFRYFGEVSTSAALVIDITGGNLQSLAKTPTRDNMIVTGVTGQITSNLTADFHFGWVRNRTAQDLVRPDASAGILAIPGTESGLSDGQKYIALDPGGRGGAQNLLSEPIDVDTQLARKQGNDNRNFQWNADLTWVKGNHTLQFGSHVRYLPTLHLRDDKVVGALGALVAQLDSDLGTVSIPGVSRPPTCQTDPNKPNLTTKNCLSSTDVQQWNRLFASTLGIVDNVSVLAVRDGSFKPLPFGAQLEADTTLWAPEFYFQDVWRLRPSLTLTYGLNYGWQTPPTEKLGRQSVQVDGTTLQEQTSEGYLSARLSAAQNGKIYNPAIAFLPINQAKRDGVFDIDWNNLAPRVAVSWNPSFSHEGKFFGSGFIGRLFGERKTVIRAGYSLVYDRQNTVQSVIVPTLGVAFAQTLNITSPLCNSTGAGGRGCLATSTNPAANGFRVGVDGRIPIPTVPNLSIPVSPYWGPNPANPSGSPILFPEVLSFQVDPKIKVGENHAIDVTWQRELPRNMVLEVGYVGRYASKLPQSMSFGQVPYMFLDPASGQTFAQAFDAVAAELRGGTAAANVTPQKWFENLSPGGTRSLAAAQTSNFINGNLNQIFLTIDTRRMQNGLQPFNNYLAQTLFLRSSTGSSNYNALFVTFNKRFTQGLLYTVNYTFSRAFDQLGVIQNAANVMPNSFDLNAEYGPSPFDITHQLNASWLYELPFGKGKAFSTSRGPLNKLIGGWYLSGIFTARSGDPLTVTQGPGVWGGSLNLGFNSGAIPIVDPHSFDNTVHSGVSGGTTAGGVAVGTNGNPASRGTGLNLFADPAAVFSDFRRVNVSQDGRAGRANPLRGLPRWNLDTSLGKRTAVSEKVNVTFAFDFFNVFNHVDFANPALDLRDPRTFGVITTQLVPADRVAGSRWIQFGMRIEF